MALGDIGAVIASLEFEPVICYFPGTIHVSGDIYTIALRMN
ncbi:unnamed protein product [marine sediment metagenome]|uniref:Uncharacterized protein n=1 Tax=marine sediment metagenome TaxID=412755 RepID=X1RPD7_9ZZZZ